MSEGISERDFGRLESEVVALTRAVAALTERMEAMNTTLSEARGGWRTLIWIAGAAATAGGAIAWVLSHFTWKG